MASGSKTEWTQATWNPVTGCSKASDGCKHCYAERMAHRLRSMGTAKYSSGFEVAVHNAALKNPLRGIKPRLVFVNSMSDLFHESVESAFIETLFEVMNSCPQHTFQVLTKRPGRVKELDCRLDWTPNIWLGVSIESERWLSRMHLLCRTGAAIKFLSLEPLLGPLPPRGADIRQMDRPRLVLPSV